MGSGAGLWWLPGALIAAVGLLTFIFGFATGGTDAVDGVVFGGVALVAGVVMVWRRAHRRSGSKQQVDAATTPELIPEERLAWVWSTVETLTTLYDMDDDLLTYTVFEPLDIDACTALSEANLTALVDASVLSEPLVRALLGLGAAVRDLIERAHERGDRSAASIRRSAEWAQVIRDSHRLLTHRSEFA